MGGSCFNHHTEAPDLYLIKQVVPVGVILMFHSVARAIASVLLAPISVVSALIGFRRKEKTAADRILEKRGLKAADIYNARLGHRMKQEEHRIESQDHVEA